MDFPSNIKILTLEFLKTIFKEFEIDNLRIEENIG